MSATIFDIAVHPEFIEVIKDVPPLAQTAALYRQAALVYVYQVFNNYDGSFWDTLMVVFDKAKKADLQPIVGIPKHNDTTELSSMTHTQIREKFQNCVPAFSAAETPVADETLAADAETTSEESSEDEIDKVTQRAIALYLNIAEEIKKVDPKFFFPDEIHYVSERPEDFRTALMNKEFLEAFYKLRLTHDPETGQLYAERLPEEVPESPESESAPTTTSALDRSEEIPADLPELEAVPVAEESVKGEYTDL